MSVAIQLGFDGSEIELGLLTRIRHTRVTPAQRAILLHIDAFGSIAPWQAGRIVHADRKARGGTCGIGARVLKTTRAKSCCAYAASDGYAALRRLEKRGVVVRLERGKWARP